MNTSFYSYRIIQHITHSRSNGPAGCNSRTFLTLLDLSGWGLKQEEPLDSCVKVTLGDAGAWGSSFHLPVRELLGWKHLCGELKPLAQKKLCAEMRWERFGQKKNVKKDTREAWLCSETLLRISCGYLCWGNRVVGWGATTFSLPSF